MKRSVFSHWQTNFWAGLAVVLPAVISIAVVVWLFGTVANITDLLLFFLPRSLTHVNNGVGPMHWYWSMVAFTLAVFLISLVGLLARNYIGKRVIYWMEFGLLRVPLVNKIYSATKQVNDAFSASNKTAFRTVALVEFPHPGSYTIGFITNEQLSEVQAKTGQRMFCIFMPTTPNPTSGFLLLVPANRVIKLEMPVSDAIKYVISLGSIMPEYTSPPTSSVVPSAAFEPIVK